MHTWDARARFITRAVQANVERHAAGTPYYVRPAALPLPPEPFLRCIDKPRSSTFTEVQAKRPLRRFTVHTCAVACRKRSTHFAVHCGGFCSGNGHRLARCFCAKVPYGGSTSGRPRPHLVQHAVMHAGRGAEGNGIASEAPNHRRICASRASRQHAVATRLFQSSSR